MRVALVTAGAAWLLAWGSVSSSPILVAGGLLVAALAFVRHRWAALTSTIGAVVLAVVAWDADARLVAGALAIAWGASIRAPSLHAPTSGRTRGHQMRRA